MSQAKWHYRIAKRLRDFHRREGAFTALAFGILFTLGILNVVGAQTRLSPELTHISDSISRLSLASLDTGEYTVKWVIDGDTILLSNGEYVRYIGIDTPEIFPDEDCFALQATLRNKELVDGKQVRLVRDVSNRDPVGRWLRYVYVGDVLINQVLVEEGFATAVAYPPDTSFEQQFTAAQNKAQATQVGRWKTCQE